MKSVCEQIIENYVKNPQLFQSSKELGERIYDIYSSLGVPPDITFARFKEQLYLGYPTDLLAVMHGFQTARGRHKTASGISDKRQKETQERNIRELNLFLKTGEFGLY